MSFRNLLLAIVLAALGALATGCTPAKTMQAASKMAKIAMDPDMAIGPPKDQPSVANITLYAEPGVNKNDFGQASPVDVWVFQLSDEDKLMSTDFLTLSDDPKGALATSYVSHQQKQVKPGESAIMPAIKLDDETTLIGVAVGYSNIENVKWRAVERVKATGEEYNILVPIRSKSVAVQIHR